MIRISKAGKEFVLHNQGGVVLPVLGGADLSVDAAYPLYGTMRLESGARRGPPPPGAIWIGKALASRLDLTVGGAVKFGDKSFRIDGIIADEPDRLGEGFTLGPVAIIGLGDLAAPGMELVFGEIPFRPDQVMHMQANIARLKAATGWAPQVPFAAGIAQTVAWYREHHA